MIKLLIDLREFWARGIVPIDLPVALALTTEEKEIDTKINEIEDEAEDEIV